MNRYVFSKSLPVVDAYDVAVAGSGPAGICAAVAAARQGAKVVLIERYGMIGGMLTGGHVGPILGAVCPGTMADEVMSLLEVKENDAKGYTAKAHDFEKAKINLTRFVNHENITVLLQTQVVDVMKEGNCLKGLIVSGRQGMYVIPAKVIIDATGDADVAYLSGCEIKMGRDDGLMQPTTLEFLVDNVDEEKGIFCVGDIDNVQFNGERFLDWCKRCGEEGLLPKNIVAVRLHPTVHPGEREVNTTQANGVNATDENQIYPAELLLRNQIELLVEFFRKYLPGYENCHLASAASTLGVRETRRVMGEYILTGEEVVAKKHFPDVAVHNAEFWIDIHNPNGAGQAEKADNYGGPFDIPYGCFVPKQIDGLLTAGRCISGTHHAHASYRVMSICMAMGQAVGIAAAICASNECLPRDLDVGLLQNALANEGIDLFH